MNRTVVSVATTSTVNITGFLTITRGSSLRKASTSAGPRIFGSLSVDADVRLAGKSHINHDCPRL